MVIDHRWSERAAFRLARESDASVTQRYCVIVLRGQASLQRVPVIAARQRGV
jgi:hypothetical protein